MCGLFPTLQAMNEWQQQYGPKVYTIEGEGLYFAGNLSGKVKDKAKRGEAYV